MVLGGFSDYGKFFFFFFLSNVGTSEAEATSAQAVTIERRPRGAEPEQLEQAGHGGRESEGKEKHKDVCDGGKKT